MKNIFLLALLLTLIACGGQESSNTADVETAVEPSYTDNSESADSPEPANNTESTDPEKSVEVESETFLIDKEANEMEDPNKEDASIDPATEPVVSEPVSPTQGEPVVGEPVSPVVVDFSDLPPNTKPQEELQVMPAPGVPGPPANLEGLVAQMITELSQELGVSETAVTLTNTQAVTWRDGSLGCPSPDSMYTMALVDGYQVILSADGKDYFFHTNGSQNYIFCKNGKVADDTMITGGEGADK